MKHLKKIRRILINKDLRKYLRYAIGEVFLIAIGLLIALAINDWTEYKKDKNKLKEIHSRILDDVNDDIQEITQMINTYEKKRHIFQLVMNNLATSDLLDVGLSRLIVQDYRIVFNKTGIDQLRQIPFKDSLSLKIIKVYDLMINDDITPYELIIEEQSIEFRNLVRDNHSWYLEWILKRINKKNSSQELKEYFTNSKEYKHWVAGNHQIMYNNYVPNLKKSLVSLEEIKKDLVKEK
ncbi:hypothetical protein GCM10011344_43710 [Dokdonia pacifica]|uniref:Uncharacterized protein n=1 Tax=Dokdonia pacifica TaxID=1627892 RepID=A0A239ADZ1_9FLAO|nr:hypothetical protein [Dokdonia pacifica]GGG38118.1 hypothetical protein GCM10011344_43710 [Dokdonia pacifica]SNR93592.1 hypothetical protein SAMN06265376_104348 [Dokdonia pacifica]